MLLVVGPGGLEPPTPALSTRCSNQLSYGPIGYEQISLLNPFKTILWWSRSGSNRRPVACKATALPAELRPRLKRSPLLDNNKPDKERFLIL
jgi:hypothetical protein